VALGNFDDVERALADTPYAQFLTR